VAAAAGAAAAATSGAGDGNQQVAISRIESRRESAGAANARQWDRAAEAGAELVTAAAWAVETVAATALEAALL